MDAQTATKGMVSVSGKAPGELAVAMGKGRTYVYSLLNHESVPRLDTFVRLAQACGYRLVLATEDVTRGVELYTEVDVKGPESDEAYDLAHSLLEKSVGKDAVENMTSDEWYEAVQRILPHAVDLIHKREEKFFAPDVSEGRDCPTMELF